MTEPTDIRVTLRILRIELRILNDKVASAAGLNPRDLEVLDVVDRDGASTPSHIAERTGYHRATLTVILTRLEHDGWITRKPDPQDGRSSTIHPTQRFDELQRLYAPIDEPAEALTQTLTPEERNSLIQVLDQLAHVVRLASSTDDLLTGHLPLHTSQTHDTRRQTS